MSRESSDPPPFQLEAAEVLARLHTDAQAGLDPAEAERRLQSSGPNRLTVRKPVPSWRKFLAQFQDVLVILLLIATVISAVLWALEHDAALPYEAIAIFAVVMLASAIFAAVMLASMMCAVEIVAFAIFAP